MSFQTGEPAGTGSGGGAGCAAGMPCGWGAERGCAAERREESSASLVELSEELHVVQAQRLDHGAEGREGEVQCVEQGGDEQAQQQRPSGAELVGDLCQVGRRETHRSEPQVGQHVAEGAEQPERAEEQPQRALRGARHHHPHDEGGHRRCQQGVREACGSDAGEAEQPPEGEQGPRLGGKLAGVVAAQGGPDGEQQSHDDVEQADGEGEQEQRLQGRRPAPVEPQRRHPEVVSEAAQGLAVQDAEHDGPPAAQGQHTGDLAGQARPRPPQAEPPGDGDQQRAVDDVADHDAEEDRQRQGHESGRVQAVARRPGQEAHELLERLPRGTVPEQDRSVVIRAVRWLGAQRPRPIPDDSPAPARPAQTARPGSRP